MLEKYTQGIEGQVEVLLPVVPGLRVDIIPTMKSTERGEIQRGTLATRVFEEGERVFVVSGPILDRPTIYSFQLDVNHHIDPKERDGGVGIGHFVNHSCRPNTGWGGVMLDNGRIGIIFVAIRRILPGEEVTFDYATTEWDTEAKVECECNKNPECRKRLHGYRDLPQERRDMYRSIGIIPPYLLEQVGNQDP